MAVYPASAGTLGTGYDVIDPSQPQSSSYYTYSFDITRTYAQTIDYITAEYYIFNATKLYPSTPRINLTYRISQLYIEITPIT